MSSRQDSKAAMEDVSHSILDEHSCHLGEGSAYDADRDVAYWFDILERRLMEADLASGRISRHVLPFMGSVLCTVDDQRQLVAGDDGIYIRTIADGGLTLYLALEADKPANRSNDGRAHPSGAVWIGTMGRKAEAGAGAIYRLFEGRVERLFANVTIPNAICFSPDGATGYFTDTRENILYRVALDPTTSAPVGHPATLFDQRGGRGALDGAVVDAEGLIWNARWGAGCVDAYSPDGERVRTVRVPATRPTCPVFVGTGFDRLLVVTAREGMSEAQIKGDPLCGQTFVLDVGARGKAEPRVTL